MFGVLSPGDDGPSRRALLIAAGIVGVPILYGSVLSLFFDPPPAPGPEHPMVVREFATPGTSCEDFKKVFAFERPSERNATRKVPCEALSSSADPLSHMHSGEVAVLLDPQIAYPGRTGERRIGRDRYFVIRINPATFNSETWSHEFGGHLLQGHTALKVPSWLDLPTNVILDLMYVDPYLLFGDHWELWMAGLALLALSLCWVWFR